MPRASVVSSSPASAKWPSTFVAKTTSCPSPVVSRSFGGCTIPAFSSSPSSAPRPPIVAAAARTEPRLLVSSSSVSTAVCGIRIPPSQRGARGHQPVRAAAGHVHPGACPHELLAGEESEAGVRPGDQVGATGQVGKVLGVPRLLSCHDFDPTAASARRFGAALRGHEEFAIGRGRRVVARRIGWAHADPRRHRMLADRHGRRARPREHPDPRRGRAAAAVARRRARPFLVLTNNSIFTPRDSERAAARVRAGRARGVDLDLGPRDRGLPAQPGTRRRARS